jgi:hypothetical protein
MDRPQAPKQYSEAHDDARTAADVNRRLLTTLATWGAASTAVGTGLWLRAGDDPRARAFGRQTAAWGAVDLAIAGIGFWRARAGAEPTPVALRRTLGINAVLDVGYISGGWWLRRNAERVQDRLPRYSAASARGDGAAVMVQGGFLLALDTGFAVLAGRSTT